MTSQPRPADLPAVIKPIAMPGIHRRFMPFLKQVLSRYDAPKVLDVGAGHGAMAQELHQAGVELTACDLFPEYFHYDQIPCDRVDVTGPFPYPDNSFDVIMTVEVMEHIHDHVSFFREAFRMLKPGGAFLFSTPNILSLKSRVRFLWTGFFYAFGPLEHERQDGLQHIASLTKDQYENLAMTTGFSRPRIAFDKRQKSSRWLLFLWPLMWVICWIKGRDFAVHNHRDLLTARVLFVEQIKPLSS